MQATLGPVLLGRFRISPTNTDLKKRNKTLSILASIILNYWLVKWPTFSLCSYYIWRSTTPTPGKHGAKSPTCLEHSLFLKFCLGINFNVIKFKYGKQNKKLPRSFFQSNNIKWTVLSFHSFIEIYPLISHICPD